MALSRPLSERREPSNVSSLGSTSLRSVRTRRTCARASRCCSEPCLPRKVILHFSVFICRPMSCSFPLNASSYVVFVSGAPPITPSSRYQMWISLDIGRMRSSMGRANHKGAIGSSCCCSSLRSLNVPNFFCPSRSNQGGTLQPDDYIHLHDGQVK